MKKRIYNQQALFGPLYAYLAVLSPPDGIKADIANIKRDICKISDIGERNLHSIAHITLTDRLTDDADFAETIAGLIKPVKPFTIKIKGWDFFDHGHSITVFLKIEEPAPITELMSLVKSTSKVPHISLAKKIPHGAFQAVSPYLHSLDYAAEWMCTEAVVLRKLMSEKHLGFKESISIPFIT